MKNNINITKSTEVENDIDVTKSIEVENNIEVKKSIEVENNINVTKSTQVEKLTIKREDEPMVFDEKLGINYFFSINLLDGYVVEVNRPRTLFLRTRPLVHDSLRVFFNYISFYYK